MMWRIAAIHGRQILQYFALIAAAAAPAVGAAAVQDEVAGVGASDTTATMLLIAGIILLLLEIKIVSQGLLGFLASICLVGATVIIWRDGGTFWGIPLSWVIPVVIFILALGVTLTVLSIRAYKEKIASGYESFAGEIGEAFEALNPEGRVFFQGTYWRAKSIAPVEKGEKVRVVSANHLRLVVEPASHPPSVMPAERDEPLPPESAPHGA